MNITRISALILVLLWIALKVAYMQWDYFDAPLWAGVIVINAPFAIAIVACAVLFQTRFSFSGLERGLYSLLAAGSLMVIAYYAVMAFMPGSIAVLDV